MIDIKPVLVYSVNILSKNYTRNHTWSRIDCFVRWREKKRRREGSERNACRDEHTCGRFKFRCRDRYAKIHREVIRRRERGLEVEYFVAGSVYGQLVRWPISSPLLSLSLFALLPSPLHDSLLRPSPWSFCLPALESGLEEIYEEGSLLRREYVHVCT